MKRIVTMDIEEYIALPSEIAHAIIERSKKGYGFRFISRYTGEEITDEMTLTGFLLGAIWEKMEPYDKTEKDS